MGKKSVQRINFNFFDVSFGRIFYPFLKRKYYNFYSLPEFVKIETTNFCNASCKYCPHKKMKRKKGFMHENLFKKIVLNISSLKIKEIHLTNFGESLLDKKIFEKINFIKKTDSKIRTVIITNGFLLNEVMINKLLNSKLDELRISFDGFSKEHYETYRKPFNFDDIKKKIILLSTAKKKAGSGLKITLIVVYDDSLENKVKRLKEQWKNIVDEVATQKIHNWSSNKKSNFKNYFNLPCRDVFRYMTINWNGDVVTCCLDYEGKIVLGNLNEENIENIWFGSKFKRLRRNILCSRGSIVLCKDCSLPLNYDLPFITFYRFMNNKIFDS